MKLSHTHATPGYPQGGIPTMDDETAPHAWWSMVGMPLAGILGRGGAAYVRWIEPRACPRRGGSLDMCHRTRTSTRPPIDRRRIPLSLHPLPHPSTGRGQARGPPSTAAASPCPYTPTPTPPQDEDKHEAPHRPPRPPLVPTPTLPPICKN